MLCSFHVIIPSLPGFALSSYPSRFEFTLVDYARIFNYLMTTVLGYKHYVGQGGDWVGILFVFLLPCTDIHVQGAWILRVIGSSHSESCTLTHFNMSHLPPAGPVSAVFRSKFIPNFIKRLFNRAGYTEAERKMIERQKQFMITGGGYRELQRTKVGSRSTNFPDVLTHYFYPHSPRRSATQSAHLPSHC